jgi:hypothetical protein
MLTHGGKIAVPTPVKRAPATPDVTAEEHRQRGEAAAALFCEIVRRAALPDGE